MEGKYIRRSGSRVIGIQDNRGIFSRDKKGVWRRRQRISKNSRVEKTGVSRSLMMNLVFIFLLTFLFYFTLLFLFLYFLYLEQLGLELIGHAVTSVTS